MSAPSFTKGFLVLTLFTASTYALAQHEHHDHKGRPAASGDTWTIYPLLRTNMSRGGAPAMRVEATGGGFDRLLLQTPEKRQAVELAPGKNGWVVSKELMGSGGHLWFTALRQGSHEVLRSSTYFFFPAKHHIPTEMLRSPRGGLEIVPLRLQEHGGVREGTTWPFLIRYENLPLADAEVQMESEGGSRIKFTADRNGLVDVVIPRDFTAEKLASKEGMGARQEFVMAVRHQAAGVEYITTYNQFYNPDRMREKSLAAGVVALACGMLLAVPLLRRKGKKNA